jgi:hypothetical protein
VGLLWYSLEGGKEEIAGPGVGRGKQTHHHMVDGREKDWTVTYETKTGRMEEETDGQQNEIYTRRAADRKDQHTKPT